MEINKVINMEIKVLLNSNIITETCKISFVPKNSTLWSLSSSYTVTSKTLLMSLTLKVNILFQDGVKVLYSVWVCRRALPNSRTQKGSLLPPRSAEARPWALNTFTVRWPTSLTLWKVLGQDLKGKSIFRDKKK